MNKLEFKELLIKNKWVEIWHEGAIYQFGKDDMWMNVIESSDRPSDYVSFHICPKDAFDRWANSRQINFEMPILCKHPVSNINSRFETYLDDAEWLAKTIPIRMFNNFIQIDL